MTTCLGIICKDGLVMGTDKKQIQRRGARMQSMANKIAEFTLPENRPLLIARSGAVTIANEAIAEINPKDFAPREKNPSLAVYLSEFVERKLPLLFRDYFTKHGEKPIFSLIVGSIKNGEPELATVYNNGTYDMKDKFATAGSGGPFAEFILRDAYNPKMSIQRGETLTAYTLYKTSQINSDTEGIVVKTLSKDGEVNDLSPYKGYLTEFSESSVDYSPILDDIEKHTEDWEERAKEKRN